MNLIKKISSTLLLLTLFVAIADCLKMEDEIDMDQAYAELYSVIDYKESECGHKPGYPLILPETPTTYGVKLCSLTIMRMECPFHDYPLFCWEIYSDVCEYCDLPGIGP